MVKIFSEQIPSKQNFHAILTKTLIVLTLLILLNTFVLAISNENQIKIFAVTDKDDGIIADLFLHTIPGSGSVAFITSNSLVGKDTQLTGNIALTIAQQESKISANSHDFIFNIKASASEVDGPSAGAAMTLLAYSVLTEKPLDKKIGITGTINSDGSIGVVGGIGAKAKVASENGIKLLMIPSGQALTYVKEKDDKGKSVNLLAYGPEHLGLKVVEVSTIRDVISFAYSDINEIEVNVIDSSSIFIPEAIVFDSSLTKMVGFSKNYITRAKKAVSDAEKELENSKLDDSYKVAFYYRLSEAKRGIELSQIYLDQNYLYSAANYSFNSTISADTISLIASIPSLLSIDSKILGLKINDLKHELLVLKKEMVFVPIEDLEWWIGAQQRIGYAENALNNIANNFSITDDLSEVDEELLQYSKVYEFVSAQQWVKVARDFFDESKKSKTKKVPVYSEEFVLKTTEKIGLVEKLILDSNLPAENLAEANKRLQSAKISLDNNFYFAALYDAFFSEAFVESGTKRFTDVNIFEEVTSYSNIAFLRSLWANLYFDHATFFVKEASYEKENGRILSGDVRLNNALDIIVLSSKIELGYNEVINYLSKNDLGVFVSNEVNSDEPLLEITYVKKNPSAIYFVLLIICLLILIVLLVFVGIGSSRTRGFKDVSRVEKINFLLARLDRALAQKKISDTEYFFLKKKYSEEYSDLNKFREDRSKITLNLSESKAKLFALQNGLKDLKRHYHSGLILPEDYTKQLTSVNSEIVEIKQQIKELESELRNSRKILLKKQDVVSGSKKKGLFSFFGKKDKMDSEFNVKGTSEKEKDEVVNKTQEKIARRELLSSYKQRKSK